MIQLSGNSGKELALYANGSSIQMLAKKLDEGLSALNGKLQKVRTTITELATSMNEIVSKATTLESHRTVIDATEITKLQSQMQEFNTKVDGVNKSLNQMVDEVNNPPDEKYKRMTDNF